MLTAHLKDLYRHMDWADGAIWTSVLASDAAAVDDYVIKTLHHLHGTQFAFVGSWLGRDFRSPKRDEFERAADLASWATSIHEEMRSFVAQQTEDELRSEHSVPWAGYITRMLGVEPATTTLGDTVFQVPSHSMHHRGQVARRIRELGETPPATDLIIWAWRGRPAPDWPV